MSMRNPFKPILSCLFSLLFLPALAADLKTYSDVYQKNSDEIRQSFQPKFDDLQKQYQKSLETLKTHAQGQGDLKTTKAAVAEIARFIQAKSLPATLDENEIPEIKAFQATYEKQYSLLEKDMTAKLGDLTVKYEQALDRLMKNLTKAGKLDEATEVEAEQTKAQAAIKGYAEQMASLTGPPATNAASVATAPKPATAARKSAADKDLYLVIDLSHGMKAKEYPVTTLADVPKGGWTDEYKTDKLVLRKIEPHFPWQCNYVGSVRPKTSMILRWMGLVSV